MLLVLIAALAPWLGTVDPTLFDAASRDLRPGQAFVVPKGVMHRPRAPEHTVILMVETAGIVPTGDT